MEHVGEAIRHHRKQRGLTQEELAERAGIAATSVVRLESGEVKAPRLSTLHKLSEALSINPTELVQLVSAVRPPAHKDRGTYEPFTAVYQRDGEWWLGYVEELAGANAQERSLEECRESLREAVDLVLEANRELTKREFEGDVVREPIGA